MDAEDLYHRLLDTVKSHDFEVTDEADDLLSRACEAIVGGANEGGSTIAKDDRGPNAHFQMYTRAGNDAVADAVRRVLFYSGTSRSVVIQNMQDQIRVVSLTHPEVYDTEPRGAVLDALNEWLDRNDYKQIDYL